MEIYRSLTQAQREQLKQLLEFWPDPAVIIDNSGRLCAYSPLAEHTLCVCEEGAALSAHTVLCASARGVAHSHDDCPFAHPLALPNGKWQSAFWCTHAGTFLSVDIRSTPLSEPFTGLVVWSFISNDDRKHNQAELEKFAQFIELSPVAIAEFESSGQLLFANPALQQLMIDAGFNDEGLSMVLPQGLEDICQRCFTAHDSDLVEVYAVDFPTLNLEWRFHKIVDEQGTNASVLAYATDITLQKQAQQVLATAQSDARRDFYAKMVHELRTPLNAIMGFSDLLLKRAAPKLTERECGHLEAIKIAGFQLNELVSDTLDISKIEAGHMELELSEFSFNDLCSAFLPQMDSLAKAKKLPLIVALDNDLHLQSDRQKVRQILINLLSNAIKYTPKGSVTLVAKREGEWLKMDVIDTGIGVPPEQIDKLFSSYRQIKEDRNIGIQGTGLGLALVQDLVTMLNGKITVHSEYEKGSTFSCWLPLHRSD